MEGGESMKRILAVLLVLGLALPLCACGTPKTVPEQQINWEIEDYLKEKSGILGECTEYHADVVHSTDKETKTDTVTIELTVIYPNCTAAASYEQTYQYEKANEVWKIIRGPGWSGLRGQQFETSTDPEWWMAAFRDEGIDDLEFSEGEKELQNFNYLDEEELNRLEKDVIRVWFANGENEGIECCTFGSEESAEAYWRMWLKMITDLGYDSEYDRAEEENYSWVRLQDDYRDGREILFHAGSSVFILYSGRGDLSWEAIDRILLKAGFFRGQV